MFAGAQLKEDYYRAQEEWLEDEENLKKWEEQTISAGDRRILITHWLAEAAERFRKRGTCAASWSRTGCGMSIDGSGDDAIVVSGVQLTTRLQNRLLQSMNNPSKASTKQKRNKRTLKNPQHPREKSKRRRRM